MRLVNINKLNIFLSVEQEEYGFYLFQREGVGVRPL